MSVEEIAKLPLPRCPCCGKEWPVGMKPLTYGEWFLAVDAAVGELGTMRAENFVDVIRRAAEIAKLRQCEALS